jgi:hypothetical protein
VQPGHGKADWLPATCSEQAALAIPLKQEQQKITWQGQNEIPT